MATKKQDESAPLARAVEAGQAEAAPLPQSGSGPSDDEYSREQAGRDGYELTGHPAFLVKLAVRKYTPPDKEYLTQDEIKQAVETLLHTKVEV